MSVRPHILEPDGERQVVEVALTYHRMKAAGLKPEKSIADIGREFGVEPLRANVLSMRALARLRSFHGRTIA